MCNPSNRSSRVSRIYCVSLYSYTASSHISIIEAFLFVDLETPPSDCYILKRIPFGIESAQ